MLVAWTTAGAIRPDQVRADPVRAWLRPFYSAYERWLARQVSAAARPRHIGIILDGNRRHGQRRGLHEPRDIYDLGARKLDDVLGWCGELAVPAVTLWVCSTDNLDRSPHQVSGILAAVEAKLRTLACDPVIHRRRVRVQAIGKLQLLPASLVAAIEPLLGERHPAVCRPPVSDASKRGFRLQHRGLSAGSAERPDCRREDHAPGAAGHRQHTQARLQLRPLELHGVGAEPAAVSPPLTGRDIANLGHRHIPVLPLTPPHASGHRCLK